MRRCIARARAMMPYVHQMFENAMVVSSLSALGTGALGAICDELGDPTMAIRLLAGIEVDSGAPSRAMWELGRVARSSAAVSAAFEAGPDAVLDRLEADGGDEARAFLARFEQFLHDHGSRAQNEYDPRAPSWELRPASALVAIDLMRQSDERQAPAVRHARVGRGARAGRCRHPVQDRRRRRNRRAVRVGADVGAPVPGRTRTRQDEHRAGDQRGPSGAVRVRTSPRRPGGHRRRRAVVHGHRRRTRSVAGRTRIVRRRDRRSVERSTVGCSTSSRCSP